MKIFELSGTRRTNLTKAAVKSLRKNGQVPCVLYGNKIQNSHFCVANHDIKNLIYTPNSYVVDLTVDGIKHLAILHDLQFHPVTDEVLHIDFLAADESQPVTMHIPVVIEGVSEGVKAGGKLIINARKLSVKGLIKDLPDTLPINITDLKLGKAILAGDLSYPHIQIVSPKETIICAVKMTRAAVAAATATANAGK